MAFRTLVSKYKGICKRCNREFPAGTTIKYGGRGNCWHPSKDCPASEYYQGPKAETPAPVAAASPADFGCGDASDLAPVGGSDGWHAPDIDLANGY